MRVARVALLIAAVLGLIAAVLGGCASGSGASGSVASFSPSTSSSAAASVAASSPPSSPVVGIVLTIDSSGLTQVHGFTLRTNDGQVLTFTIGQLDNPTQFPPGHLAEHQASALPVRVFFRSEGGALVVYRLEDAAG